MERMNGDSGGMDTVIPSSYEEAVKAPAAPAPSNQATMRRPAAGKAGAKKSGGAKPRAKAQARTSKAKARPAGKRQQSTAAKKRPKKAKASGGGKKRAGRRR